MTLEEALIVHAFPIVDQMVPNEPLHVEANEAKIAADHPLRPRSGPTVVAAGRYAAWHLKWLCQPHHFPIQGRNLDFEQYLYEESAGKDSYVYVFDAKIDWEHVVSEQF